MLAIFLVIFLALFPYASAAVCGPAANGAKCPANAPCCSTHGYCGSSGLYCAGGCLGDFSFIKSGESASCFADRPSRGRQCVSGLYDFKNTT
jgi:chitinase